MAKTKNNGVIIEKKRGLFEVQLSLGRDPMTGKYKRVSRTVHGTKADAQKTLRKLIADRDNGLKVEKSKETFGEFATSWHSNRVAAGTLAHSSQVRERQVLNTLCKYLGEETLQSITPARVEGVYRSIRADKLAKTGKPYSETTMNKIHVVLSQVMKQAVNYDLVMRNPCDRVAAPKCTDPERRSLSKTDGARLLGAIEAAEQDAYAALSHRLSTIERLDTPANVVAGLSNLNCVNAVRVGLATGARRGEVFGLTWKYVGLITHSGGKVSGVLHIRQTLDAYGNIKQPKTKAGKRDVSIDASTAESLLRLKIKQAEYLSLIGLKQTNDTPVFCSNVGGWLDLHNFERWWRNWRKQNGFEGLKFHELRHTQATQLLANGVDVKTVQSRLGHANAAITLNWYAHALPENDRKAADLVGNLFATPQNTAENVISIAV